MKDKILVLDFGSQYTQLIARRLRELCIFCEIKPYNCDLDVELKGVKGVILSGSPFSVKSKDFLDIELSKLIGTVPVLGICYGAQMIANKKGGSVEKSDKREYGKATIEILIEDALLNNVVDKQVWMSHGDSIYDVGSDFKIIAKTNSIPVAAFKSNDGAFEFPVYGVQFHPEVYHTVDGMQILGDFAKKICNVSATWTPGQYVENTVEELKVKIGTDKVILGISGGVDSTVAAVLLQKAIGDNLTCIFLDNGLLRLNEFEEVLKNYEGMGLNVIGVDAKDDFLNELEGVFDPETKRKIIGRVFIEVFEKEANKIDGVKWLGQGTIYPDVIESVSVHGPSVTIKSHHNVGGLPDVLNLQLVEPLRMLFKDEVRRVGKALNISKSLLARHPFPGPGLAIRLIGAIERDKLELLQKADKIFIDMLRQENLYDEVWQALVVLLPIKSVGVMGDERTYEYTVVLRSVNSVDGMTAEWSPLPHKFLADVSSQIINKVKGINRVVYDISTKPPSTIEWE